MVVSSGSAFGADGPGSRSIPRGPFRRTEDRRPLQVATARNHNQVYQGETSIFPLYLSLKRLPPCLIEIVLRDTHRLVSAADAIRRMQLMQEPAANHTTNDNASGSGHINRLDQSSGRENSRIIPRTPQ